MFDTFRFYSPLGAMQNLLEGEGLGIKSMGMSTKLMTQLDLGWVRASGGGGMSSIWGANMFKEVFASVGGAIASVV